MDALAGTAIERLRQAFGEKEFARLDAFVRQPVKIAPRSAGAANLSSTFAARPTVGRSEVAQ